MRRSLSVVAAVLFVGGVMWAGDECDKSKCAVGEKISKLLTSWQTAVEAEKAGCPEERAKVQTALASVAKECPIGSRIGETVGFVRNALDVAVKADELCAKACAEHKAAAGAEAKAKECEMSKLAAARSKLLKDLHLLASYATSVGGAGCDKACAKEGAVETAVKSDLCEKKIAETVASIRADKCEESATKTVLASVEGLKCEKKAGEIAAAIRKAGCEKSAGGILAKAASECRKEGTTVQTTAAKTTAAKSDLCEKKIAETVASIRADKCEESAAKTVLASVEGLKCQKKAGEIAAAIRKAGCEKSAGEILAKAASECCEKEGKTVATTAAGAEVSSKGGDCCQEVLARGKALKVSWEKAGAELTTMCPTKKKELMATFESLKGRSKTLPLIHDTVLGLAVGVDSLHAMNTKMQDWAKANPDALKSVPADVIKAFEGANAAIAEANEVMTRVKTTFKASMGSCEGEKKTEALFD